DRILVASDSGIVGRDLDGGNPQIFPAPGRMVAIHPGNGQYICSATSATQLLCSADGGRSWSSKVFFGVNQVIADPKIEGGFYVATDQGIQYVGLASGRNLNFSFTARPTPAARWMAIDPSGQETVIWFYDGASLYRSL